MILPFDQVRNYQNTVVLYNGQIKEFHQLAYDDILMGDDGTPRRILSLQPKKGKLYQINPVKGDIIVLHEDQAMSLRNKKDICISRTISKPTAKHQEDRVCVLWMKDCKNNFISFSVVKYTLEGAQKLAEDFKQNLIATNNYTRHNFKEISPKQYLSKSKSSIVPFKLYKGGTDFVPKTIPFDAWAFGYWLGDGTSSNSEITTADPEILVKYEEIIKPLGLKLVPRGLLDIELLVNISKIQMWNR